MQMRNGRRLQENGQQRGVLWSQSGQLTVNLSLSSFRCQLSIAISLWQGDVNDKTQLVPVWHPLSITRYLTYMSSRQHGMGGMGLLTMDSSDRLNHK